MLNYKQYKVLKIINDILQNKKQNYEQNDSFTIIGDEIYDKIHYQKYTVDTILKELHDNKYLYDLSCIDNFKTVHTIKIENKGRDAIKYFYSEHFKLMFSKIFWMILGSIITLLCQIILKQI